MAIPVKSIFKMNVLHSIARLNENEQAESASIDALVGLLCRKIQEETIGNVRLNPNEKKLEIRRVKKPYI